MVGRVQYLLIASVSMLLSQISMTVNSSILSAKSVGYENEAIITATTVGQSVLREICSRRFDERCIGKKISSTDSLTASGSLGSETGETSYTNFDDVDDYNGKSRVVADERMGNFTVTSTVTYTPKSSPGTVSSVPTFMKAVTVTVSGNTLLKQSFAVKGVVSF